MAALLDQVFPASTEALSAVRAALRDVCQRAACGEECSEQLVLAINEACMNVIQHGYQFAEGHDFTLKIRVDNGVFVAHLLDNGVPATDADLCPRELDELRPGGLGVHFMRELMDGVAYQPAPQGFTNCLQLTKRIY
ncbi:ATP-binding protein [Propionivibrio sp.]|uniref:ATP-binding protein n=1 Tax=Propionivibrio sp. TaxID=2212460 RepID=UPI003BEF9379